MPNGKRGYGTHSSRNHALHWLLRSHGGHNVKPEHEDQKKQGVDNAYTAADGVPPAAPAISPIFSGPAGICDALSSRGVTRK